MNPKRPFGKLKSSASPSPIISFRYTKHDEEVEGVIYKNEASVDPPVELGSSKTVSAEIEKETNIQEKKRKGSEDGGSDTSELSVGSISASQWQEMPKAEPQDRGNDSYLKISRRACSLDSEQEPLESESWAFLKDLKGRIAKNIEECINKDVVKGLVSDSDSVKTASPADVRTDTDSLFEHDITNLPTSNTRADDDHISPSVEATESLDESILSCYTNNEVEIIKSEKPEASISSSSKNQFGLPLKKKKLATKPDFNMKLSALMASRSFSLEEDRSESSRTKPDAPEEPAVITGDKTTDDATNPTPETSSKSRQAEFSKIFLQIKSFYHVFIKMSWDMHVACIVFMYLVFVVMPIPSSLFWFFIGTIVSAIFMYWIMKPAAKKEKFKMPDYKNLPPLTIPALDIADTTTTIYKGWMNELPCEYNPETYHVNCTHSVYIRLDGSSLRVSYPKSNIPKRAMFNETRHEPASLYPRHHDITGASVELLPEELTKKRLWSKKYPICLRFTDRRRTPTSREQSPTQARTSKAQGSKESSPSKKYEPKVNEQGEIVLYLFARTDREKDDWYRRFLKASRIKMLKSHSPLSTPNIASLEASLSESKRAISVDLGTLQSSASLTSMLSLDDRGIGDDDDSFTEVKFDKQLNFEYYMSQLLFTPGSVLSSVKKKSLKERTDLLDVKSPSAAGQDMLWLNALIGRLFFDFLTEDVWADVVAERIQRKLSKIKLPNFIEELKITDKKLGSALPKIHRTSSPVIDQRGLWVDIDISYDGHFQMTLETKINLFRLQRSDYPFSSFSKERELDELPRRSRLYDSEEEDSAESSSDEDVPIPEMGPNTAVDENAPAASASGGSTGKRLIRLVDKIAQSSYFQSAAKNKYFKRAMTEVSNTPLVLTVEVYWLTGTLALNIPPMPTDRLWYGFRKNPELSIEARPKLGCHAVRVSHITEWIEQKLVLEFQKVLVMPNMDDLVIPIMRSDV